MPDPITQKLFQSAAFNHQNQKLTEAESLYRQVLAREPGHADAAHRLGVLLYSTNRVAEGLPLLERAVAADGANPEYLGNYAVLLRAAGRTRDAADAARQAITLRPYDAIALCTLGGCLMELGDTPGALAALQGAVAMKPDYVNALASLGAALSATGKKLEALPHLEKAVALDPNSALAHHNYAVALYRLDRLDDAIRHEQRAVALAPGYAGAHHSLAGVLKEQGHVEASVEHFAQAVRLNPDDLEHYGDLLLHMLFNPRMPPAQIAFEYGEWARRHADPFTSAAPAISVDCSPNRRLRVGYVSPGFTRHVVGLYLEPILARHDRSQFEIFCYSDAAGSDDYTERFRRHANVFRDTRSLSHEQLAAQIREDGIDILVDLSLHSMGTARLCAFARRPAPVQMSYLGCPHTSGMKAMDYHITDVHLVPPGSADEKLYTEKLLRLPHSYWCYQPPVAPPAVGPLPADANGCVTFGSLNKMVKHSPMVLRWWGEILRQLPTARLALRVQGGAAGSPSLPRHFAASGLDYARVILHDQQPSTEAYLALYNTIDIALDPLPYAGHTTSIDALYMGVPLVSLPGASAIGRAGVTLAAAVNTPELLAKDPENFVAIAVALANDLPRLRDYRATLRSRLERSPIMDAAAFTRDLESLYRTAWAARAHA